MCDEKWILYDNWWWSAQWMDREVTKHFPKPKLHRAKVRPLFGCLLLVWSSLYHRETITSEKYAQQIDEMQRKLQHLQLALVDKRDPILLHDIHSLTTRHTTNAWEAEQIGLRSFASSDIFTWPLANRLPLLQAFWQLFAGKMLSQTAGGKKNAFQEFVESWSMDFYTTGINKFMSHWQTCVDCNCPYFDYYICV